MRMIRKVLALLDGKKRALILLGYMVAAVVETAGSGYEGDAGAIRQALDWNPGLPLPVSVIVGTLLGTIAIWHAIAKGSRERAERRDTVSIRGLR